MSVLSQPIAVLGAGSYGTALAILLASNGNPTRLYARDPQQVERMRAEGCNSTYLPDVTFPPALSVTSDLAQALEGVRDLLISVPSHAYRSALQAAKPYLPDNVRILWASKGLNPESGELLEHILVEELGDKVPRAILSGPSFAKELAVGMPTAITLAANDEDFLADMLTRLHNPCFRVYASTDMTGVQVGGAVKNVIAIATGISDGIGFGANTRTAIITRGLAEMSRLGLALGGLSDTLTGMAGLGDLILTCTDDQSRNRRFGLALGKGKSVEQALKDIGQTVEGFRNTQEVKMLAERNGVEMPITNAIYQILYQNVPPLEAAKALLARDLKPEGEAS